MLMIDRNWHRLGPARAAGIPTWYGELLSEAAEHAIDLNRYGTLIAATDNDDYNALVCTDLGAELGRDRVLQVGRHEASEGEDALHVTLGGRTLLESGASLDLLELRLSRGWVFQATALEDGSTRETLRDALHEKTEIVAILRRTGLDMTSMGRGPKPQPGDTVLSFGPPTDTDTDSG